MGVQSRFSQCSKEDQINQISKYVFVTNFPDHVRAQDLWQNPFPKSYVPDKVINPGNSKGNFYNASYSSKSSGTFVSILKGDAQKHSPPDQSKPVLVLDESCIKERDFRKSLMGQVKEVSTIPNLYIVLLKEGFDYVNITYLGGLWVLFEFEALNTMEKFRNHVGIGSWFSTIKSACNSFISDERIVWVSIESLPINSCTSNTYSKVASKWGDLVVWEESEENSLSCKHLCLKTKMKEIINENSYNSDDEPDAPDEEHKFGDNEFEKLNDDSDVEKVSESSCMHGNDFVHEKASNIHCEKPPHSSDPFNIYDLLQKKNGKFPLSKDFDPIYPPGFTPVSENINKGEGSILEVMDDLVKVGHAMRWDGEVVILEDFNEVWSEQERFGSSFNSPGANAFNNFIATSGLIDLPLGDNKLSDHRPIIMCELNLDYGPTPFRIFQYWFNLEGFDSFVEDLWHSLNIRDSNALTSLKKKFQLLKNEIKSWVKQNKKKINEAKSFVNRKLTELDKIIDQGGGNEEVVNQRASLLKDLNDINSIEVSELSQKAKVRWSIKGNENSKYFHGILNSKRSQLAIRRILLDGDWIADPNKVKYKFYNHFSSLFSDHSSSRVKIDFQFPNRLKLEQVEELECSTSYDEIKKAVWDCGTNKSPGPDGFTFEFYQKYWNILDQDIVAAVSEFFASGKFPLGCNSTFITLIPKIHDAKVIKDFRPISLIGSIYKIVAKIMANRLCSVMPILISDVQTAFISNRQILDGPFILNELLAWCKLKKVNAMIFKVDFEKAFDSVRWDYLDDVLKSFGFGGKWRSWISGCLNSAKGSVLINGSPTLKFQFHKGLKQGDPLSPFLFILVMESLHLSFQRVMEAGLFKGISINNSLTISHLFYADDAVFVGKWDISNINTIVHVLKCFFLASSLKINIHKSKLTGIGVCKEDVTSAASIIGCTTFSSPFNYLGVKVGAAMSRINSWNEVIDKISSHLSKWKLKTLSIGGRLTLIKSVLAATPLYHMSLYKAPIEILNRMESIRMDFFNGVSSFYAINRDLLFKWVWRFITQDASLWYRLIKAIHGVRGVTDNHSSLKRASPWNPFHIVVKGKTKEMLLSAGNPQQDLKDKGVIDSRCSRHMTGNISYLTDYEEIDGGFVAFGGRKPALSFIRPFGCLVTILNTIDQPRTQDPPFSSSPLIHPDAVISNHLSGGKEKKNAKDTRNEGCNLRWKEGEKSLSREGCQLSTCTINLILQRELQAQQEQGEGLDMPTITQPSSSQPQKKHKPRKPKKKDAQIPQSNVPSDNLADKAVNNENVSKHSNDPLLSGEDRLKLKELMALCTNLQNRVLDLEHTKTTQALEIDSLKRRVKKLKKKQRSRTHGLRRLYKVDLSVRGVSFKDEDITLENVHDEDMFDTSVFNDEELFVGQDMAEKEVSTTDPVTTFDEVVTTANVEVSTASPTAATITTVELTLA
ncbi:RNA-directed DNA polymerase, eukaryota [Tanacetum coccineum]